MSAVERASEASSAEQANEWAAQANEQVKFPAMLCGCYWEWASMEKASARPGLACSFYNVNSEEKILLKPGMRKWLILQPLLRFRFCKFFYN